MAALVKEAVTDVIDKERHGVREGSARIDINERLMARAVGMTKKPANREGLEMVSAPHEHDHLSVGDLSRRNESCRGEVLLTRLSRCLG